MSAAYNDWGTAEANEQKFLSAMVHFQEAEHWDASTRGLMRNLGLSAAKFGDNREAVRALKIAVKNDVRDKQSRSMLAVAQFALGEYADAAKSFSLAGNPILDQCGPLIHKFARSQPGVFRKCNPACGLLAGAQSRSLYHSAPGQGKALQVGSARPSAYQVKKTQPGKRQGFQGYCLRQTPA